VVLAWLAVLVIATLAHHASGGSYSDDFSLPGTSAQQGADVLEAHQPSAGGQNGQLVFTVHSGSLDTNSSAIEQAAANVRKLPHVLAVSDPLAAGTTSPDGRTAYASVNFDTNPTTLDGYVATVDKAVQPARAAGVQVDYGGVLGQAARPKTKDAVSELIGIAVAILVLLVAFGSVYAAGLPILSAILGVIAALGLLGTLAAAITFGSVAPTLAIMMGLGVGIDYGLFLTTRHRQLLLDGHEPRAAAARTVATSGRAVLIAATTVVIAMLGLYASGVGFVGQLGLAAAVAVVVSGLTAITLVPALLGIAGRRIDRLAVRTPVAESGASGPSGGWARYAEQVGAHPWRYLGAGLAFLAVLAIPVLSMRLGHVDAGADPPSYTSNRAYEAIAKGFGPGTNGPLTVVVQLAPGTSSGAAQTLGQNLSSTLQKTPDVAKVGAVTTSPDGKVLLTTVIPASGPQDAATDALLGTLRDTALPSALHGSGAQGYVTGTTAAQLDFRDVVAARLPIIIGVVVLAAFVLLLTCFRSPFLAVKAALLNLVSIGAAYGVVVAVFQWGVPALPRPRGLARDGEQPRGGRHRPGRDRAGHLERRGDHDQRVPGLPAVDERRGQDARAGPGRQRARRCDRDPVAGGACEHVPGRPG
jgi:RND superfamily putative drug exporter